MERKRRNGSRWNDLGMDQFEVPIVSSGLVGVSAGVRDMNSAAETDPSTSESSTPLRRESSGSSAQWC